MEQNTSTNHWNSEAYDSKLDFVSKLGGGVMELLAPKPGERILDYGCGTGDLTIQLADAGAAPVGIDLSADMITRARQKFPGIDFQIADGLQYRTDHPFDAVFSNAALHWMPQAEAAAKAVWHALKGGGRFVAEFGGHGNVAAITAAISRALEKHGYDPAGRSPWYFPTLGEYSALLERIGFRVTFAQHFDRPTPLKGDSGLADWLDMFSDDFFGDIASSDKKASIYRTIMEEAAPTLYRDGGWFADYKRLRIAAVKP
ncbi:methyltransferase domain-containing protein [Cohnella boryungensis]|uniref:Class I SAM-dependent methyltransferase n=1 Tax=Cohnella boryungensis TaxID=768479 RepID=A0ABV8SET5_9BACL